MLLPLVGKMAAAGAIDHQKISRLNGTEISKAFMNRCMVSGKTAVKLLIGPNNFFTLSDDVNSRSLINMPNHLFVPKG